MQKLKILIQGEIGSFHHIATEKLFGKKIAIIPCATFAEVFAKLTDENIALVAHENSLYGNINEVYDLLEKLARENSAPIFAETELAIHQNLIGLKDVETDQVREIYSHPVALAQCENYLNENFGTAERIEFEDTAAAVRFVADSGDPSRAAIAGEQVAKLYPTTKIFAHSIEDNSVNFTKFIALAKNEKTRNFAEKILNENVKNLEKSSRKTSVILTTKHESGALFNALKIFNDAKINLTKLYSRPIVGEKFRYKFYVDFLANSRETEKIIAKISRENDVIFLGNYPVL